MLITAAEARVYIPARTGTGDDATVIEPLIKRAGHLMAARCGYPGEAPTMESATYVLDLAARDSRDLDLEVYPVASVTSAYVDSTGDYEGQEETVTVADIGIRRGRVARLLSSSSSSWSTSPSGNRITFVAGFGGSSTLNGAISSTSATTITVTSTAAFWLDSSGRGRALIDSEIVHFTGKTSTTLTGCTRGAEGTTAATHLTGATITSPVPEGLKELCARLVRHLYDMRETQGKASIATGQGGSVSLKEFRWGTKSDYTLIPPDIEAELGAYILPRAAA